MNKLFLLLFVFYFSFSQSEKTHIIYFETDKYNVLEIEKNRLLLFAEKIKKEKIKKYLFMVFVTIEDQIVII